MRTQLLAFLLLATACSLDEGGGLAALDGSPLPDAWAPDAANPSDATAPSDAVAPPDATLDAPVDVTPPSDAACDPNGCLGERCVNGVCGFYVSCSDMRQDVSRTTGAHTLRDPKSNVFDAWCDMSLDGGGWTLIGRSAVLGSSSSFGWKKATGTIGDDSKPYSLDVDAHGLVFTEALIGGYSVGKTWVGSVYKAVLPPSFLANYKGSAGATTVSKVGGYCPDNSPAMFTNMGFVDNSDQFFMRDNTTAGNFGLRADAFALNYFDCARAALLNLAQGMIFVR
ncbi:MAG TPA: fibrinogen-like YCDxxxxGGGW domain-containing protein [Polyangiaceae bacterium]